MLEVGAATVIAVENEVTYLALPPVPRAVAVFGGGFASAGLAGPPWLAAAGWIGPGLGFLLVHGSVMVPIWVPIS